MSYLSRIISISVICLLSVTFLRGQYSNNIFTPKIGDTLPNYMFTDLRNYPNKTVDLDALKGKWLVLDFWSKDCSSCVSSFPKMNQLHKQFRDSVTILMVGNTRDIKFETSGRVLKRELPTKQLYQRLDDLYNLEVGVAFDSLLSDSFGIRFLPYILILDPNGIVRGITSSVNETSISSFLAGKDPKLKRAYTGPEWDKFEAERKKKVQISKNKEFKTENDGQSIQSSLSLYDRATMPIGDLVDFENPDLQSTKKALYDGSLEIFGAEMTYLFYTAYLGVFAWFPDNKFYYQNFSKRFIFETADSARFLQRDFVKYAYVLNVPSKKASKDFFMKVMQKDLEIYFGLKARVEKRKMPVYYLTVCDTNRAKLLTTKGRDDTYAYDSTLYAQQIVLNNSTTGKLCRLIGSFIGGDQPVLDKTNLNKNIDIDLRAFIYDLKEINKGLVQYGLVLEEGTKDMETIIISDSGEFK